MTAGALGLAGLGGLISYRWTRPPSTPLQLVLPPGDLSALDRHEPFDVCVIGSGPAGMVAAHDLASKGVATVVIESGFDLGAKRDPRINELERFENSGDIDYPIAATRVRAIGGTTTVWTGRCARLHPLDFAPNAYTPTDAPWPITYDELEPYLYRAEKTLRVRGGDLSTYHAPRQNPLPLPADLDIGALKSMMREIGVTVDDSPTSTGLKGESPFRVNRDLLPRFATSPNGVLLSGATVTRLIVDSNGVISGAEVQNLDRTQKTIRAKIFIVACGALESTRLLHLSRPTGSDAPLGNRYDGLGRGFNEHPNIGFTGKVQHSWGTISPGYELGRTHQYYEQFKQQEIGSILLVFIQSWIFRDDLSNWGIDAIKHKLGRLRQAELRIGATAEMQPTDSNRVSVSRNINDYFGNPVTRLSLSFSDRDRETLDRARSVIRRIYADLGANDVEELGMTWSHHHIGGCRMGDNAKTSVVDRNLRVHDSSNLYVAGSASFVTGGAAHPTLSIAALSHRLADHLLQRLDRG